MADLVRQSEERVAAHKEEIKEKGKWFKALEEQLRAMPNSDVPSSVNQEASAKADRNDLAEIHRRHAAVLSTLQEKKCSLNQAYRLAGTARSIIRDFLGIAKLRIMNEVRFQSTLLNGEARGPQTSRKNHRTGVSEAAGWTLSDR